MILIPIVFIVAAVLLVGLLLYAVKPQKVSFLSADGVFEALSAPRHYYRLPQILQALQSSDTEFLLERGRPDLYERVRAERKEIALSYVNCLEADFRTLVEASRVLASMAPEVAASQEWERIRLSLEFSWKCKLLRWRLQTGLRPWRSFAQIAEMAGNFSYRLEQATTHIGERAVLAAELPSLSDEGRGKPR